MPEGHLLHEFVHQRSHEAFKRIVEQNLPLVWSTARRLIDDSHQAEDLTQEVFSLLAQTAAGLSPDVILSGWLHRATVHAASRARRCEPTRQHREQQTVGYSTMALQDDEARRVRQY